MLDAASVNWQHCTTDEENGAILSFLAKTEHAKNEKPPAFEGWAEELEVTPLFQLHKMSFRINSNYVFIPLGTGGLPHAF